MRNKIYIGIIALAAMAICACTRYNDITEDYHISRPSDLGDLEYLSDYLPLKEYVDHAQNPGFHLGTGIMSTTFNSKGMLYKLVCANYEELTSGYEMKHGAVVKDDGTMDFSTVKLFLENAKNAGMTVFGHALCWHENQNATYLNSLIAPVAGESRGEVLGDNIITNGKFSENTDGWYGEGPYAGTPTRVEGDGDWRCSVAKTGSGNFWDAQLCFDFADHLVAGETYELSLTFKGSASGKLNNIAIQSSYDYSYTEQAVPGDINSWSNDVEVTTEWKTVTTRIAASKDHNRMVITYGEYDGTLYVDNVSLRHVGSSAQLGPELVKNGDFEDEELAAGWQKNGSVAGDPSIVVDSDGNRMCAITRKSGDANYWEAEFAYYFDADLKAGCTYLCTFRFKATVDGYYGNHINSVSFQTSSDGTYDNTDTAFPNDSWYGINPSTEWRTMTMEITPAKDRQRFNITYGDYKDGTIYIDDVSVRQLTDGPVERSDEEKKEIITNALETWIAASMDACKDYVAAWDVVNEPMNGRNLKTGVGKELSSDEFYWQDYMGKDYAVKAIEFARKYGNEGDLLFINDYSLESSTSKLEGLLDYIEYIESQGQIVDGIGTQMHITTAADTSKIRKHFRKMAATGKLIKISELDMGLDGGVKTADATEEDMLAQKALYYFVVKTYFEEVPSAQRYGITHWSPLDAESGAWRGCEPIGLWDVDYNRKHAYAGVADGLIDGQK